MACKLIVTLSTVDVFPLMLTYHKVMWNTVLYIAWRPHVLNEDIFRLIWIGLHLQWRHFASNLDHNSVLNTCICISTGDCVGSYHTGNLWCCEDITVWSFWKLAMSHIIWLTLWIAGRGGLLNGTAKSRNINLGTKEPLWWRIGYQRSKECHIEMIRNQ